MIKGSYVFSAFVLALSFYLKVVGTKCGCLSFLNRKDKQLVEKPKIEERNSIFQCESCFSKALSEDNFSLLYSRTKNPDMPHYFCSLCVDRFKCSRCHIYLKESGATDWCQKCNKK